MDRRKVDKFLIVVDTIIWLITLYLVTAPMLSDDRTRVRSLYYGMHIWQCLALWCGQNAIKCEQEYWKVVR